MDKPLRYPIDIRSFPTIREEGYVYVDKTGYVYQLAKNGATYNFLSRPRRFGKSMLVSTLQAYFEGKKELFTGLAIDGLEKEWKVYPVVSLSLASFKGDRIPLLQEYLELQLEKVEERYSLSTTKKELGARFSQIVGLLHKKYSQKVVVLIDEYDTPILNVLHDKPKKKEILAFMQSVYVPLKDLEEQLRFVLITGITKFSQVSIFSTLNNISNISMRSEYAAVCGITLEEIRRELKASVEALAAEYGCDEETTLQELRSYYDGYKFRWPSPDIFNSYSLINCFDWKEIKPFWFQTGTPTFVVETLKKSKVLPSQLERMEATEQDFDAPIENVVKLVPLLYQSGYLTIKGYNKVTHRYTLEIPNKEVHLGLMNSLVPNYIKEPMMARNIVADMIQCIVDGDVNAALEKMKVFFKTVPYCRGTKTEGHWQQMLYVIFSLFLAYADVEVHTNNGRVDMAMIYDGKLYLWEVKLDGSAKKAIDQIELKEYTDRFSLCQLPIIKIGISFSTNTHTINDWIINANSKLRK
ncbi:MAG: ATP-binding protein [Bacteroidales bacterium]|nr:ATP-binding protein [Bacteroidales bacterium]